MHKDVEVIVRSRHTAVQKGIRSICVMCVFSFVRQSGNMVAHCLARKDVRGSGVSTWEASPPTWLANPLIRDGCFF